MAPKVVKKGGKVGKKAIAKFTIDCQDPVSDEVLDTSAFEKYLHDRIKVNGKAGDLGTKITITRDKAKVIVAAELPFSKRYLKYLTKKYIKKTELQPFLTVKATSKNTYKMKYLQATAGEDK